MKRKLLVLSSLLCIFLFSLSAVENYRAVIVASTDSSINKPWLADKIKSTLKERLNTYTNLNIIDSDNFKNIIDLQKQSENLAFDQETAVELGKLANANYGIFIKLSKLDNSYNLTVDMTDLESAMIQATSSALRSDVDGLYDSYGSAVNEILINLCKQLKMPLSISTQTFLMKGDSSLSDDEKESIYNSTINSYNAQLKELDKEINSLKVNSDFSEEAIRVEEDKLRAEKVLLEENLRFAKEEQKRVQEEMKRKEDQKFLDETRTEEQLQKINSMADEVNRKIESVRNKKFAQKSLLGQINVIELKKKAVIDIYNNIEKEKENITKQADLEISQKEDEIINKPYRAAELEKDRVTPKPFFVEKRNDKFYLARREIIVKRNQNIEKLENSIREQIVSLLAEIKIDENNLKTKKVSTLGDELSVSYGEYDGTNYGWDIYITVKSDGVILLKTTSFLPFQFITGKDPETFMKKDTDGYLDAVDFYDSLLLRGEPLFVYELTYSADPMDLDNPSKYNFSFNTLTCYDTKSLQVLNGNNLTSSKSRIFELADKNIYRQMSPLNDMSPFTSYSGDVNKIVNDYYDKIAQEQAQKQKELENKKNQEAALEIYNETKAYVQRYWDEALNGIVYLEPGTNGCAGTSASYVLFGVWPGRAKYSKVVLDEANPVYVNSLICYKGDDDLYYYYDDDKESYFLMEPIKWVIYDDNYDDGTLLVADKVLFTSLFHNDTSKRNVFSSYTNNYDKSSIRAYLNGYGSFANNCFINKAFSHDCQQLIKTTTVDNSKETCAPNTNAGNYACITTHDKIFLPSYSEIEDVPDYFIRRSDFSGNYKSWLLRSPHNNKSSRNINSVCGVDANGHLTNFYTSEEAFVVPALVISNEKMAPNVISLKEGYINGTSLSLSWKNPKNKDFKRVIISGLNDDNIVIESKPGYSCTKEINNLLPDTVYNVCIKTVDYYGNVNDSFKFDLNTNLSNAVSTNNFNLYETPEILRRGTKGSAGSNRDYVLFGVWPQTVKSKNVLIYNEKTVKVNNLDCYLGSDYCYYVKVENPDSNAGSTLSNGITKIYREDELYFKVEPIKWILANNNTMGSNLLIADLILDSVPFDTHYYYGESSSENEQILRTVNGETIYPNNYKYSYIRAYMNGLDGSSYDIPDFTNAGFIHKAFSPAAIESINTVNVDNSNKSMTEVGESLDDYKYPSENTFDKVFLLSLRDITWADVFKYTDDRIRHTTDYAIANNLYWSTSYGDVDDLPEFTPTYAGYWWTRSPSHTTYNVYMVYPSNKYYTENVYKTIYGLVPAITVSF